MHIHLIRTRYPHWGLYSGIHQFVRYIDQSKYDIDIQVASDSDEDFPISNKVIRNRLRHAVQRRGMQWYKLSDLVAELRAFRKSCRQKVDVIHYLDGEHSAQFLPTLCQLPRRVRPRIIATYHQPPELLDSLLIKKVISKLDFIIVVSPEQISYFRELTAPNKIRSILHGINVDYFKPGKITKEKGKFKCVTVGKYLRDFGALRKVAESLSIYRNIEFHVVSAGAAEVEDLANVTVYKNINDTNLLKLYQQSDLLFLPLVWCTANNALLEGIACGLPVVSTDLPSVKAYLSDKEAILIQDNNPNQLAEAILHLVNNPADCENMGLKARKRAEELDWQRIAPLYEAVYSQVTSCQGATNYRKDLARNKS